MATDTQTEIAASSGGQLGGHLAASQLKNWRLCQRRWGFEKIDKLPVPQTKAQGMGIGLHKQIEQYYQHGMPIPEDSRLQAALPFLPAPVGIYAERKFELSINGVLFIGYKDLQTLHGERVWDLKTTRNLKWQKTEAQLRADEQATIYAYDGILLGIAAVGLSWIYVRTEGAPKAAATNICLTKSEVEDRLVSIGDDAQRMVRARREAKSGLELEPNWASCTAFGGCPFMARCHGGGGLLQKARLAHGGVATMSSSLEEKLKASLDRLAPQTEEGREMQQRLAENQIVPPDAPPAAESLAAEMPATAAEEPPKKGRKKKAQPDAQKPQENEQSATQTAPQPQLRVLIINAAAVKGAPPPQLSDLLAPVMEELHKIEVADPTSLDYGKYARLLRSLFVARYEGKLPPMVFADSNTPEHGIVLGWLIGQAAAVVQGY